MLKTKSLYILLVIAINNFAVGVPKPEDKHEKILHEKEHYKNEEHNKEYDHEAFLGEEAKTFDQLTPEESKRRLSLIVDKIDKNNDGEVDFEELQGWIKYTQSKYLTNDVDKQWKTHNVAGSEKITWDQYRKSVYGFSEDNEALELDLNEDLGGYSYKAMLDRDRRRWHEADEDSDGALNREEFAAFLHPEEAGRMKNIVILETLEDIDKNKDGKISLEEYITDLYHQNIEDGEDLPDWVKSERDQFTSYRDKNGDGFMDADEVRDWIFPQGFDHAEAETRHLILESDSNDDQKLTKEEILNKYDLFVGSQATDFGEALTRHDEF